ncbi:uncharacterized protein FYW23_003593 isoform 1-T1 [Sylvia borin]
MAAARRPFRAGRTSGAAPARLQPECVPRWAESEAQDEFVNGFGNPQSGLCHALQAERCHMNSGATELENNSLECGVLMHLEMLPLPFLLVRNTAWFHRTAGSSCSLNINSPGMKLRVVCHSRKRSGLMGSFRT